MVYWAKLTELIHSMDTTDRAFRKYVMYWLVAINELERLMVKFVKTISGMATSQTIPTKLSNLQMELLKLYPYTVSEAELKDIQRLLATYFAQKIDAEMDLLWQEKGWNEQTIEQWKAEHLRSRTVQ